MCSITGFSTTVSGSTEAQWRFYMQIVDRSSLRGRDAWGVVAGNRGGILTQAHLPGRPNGSLEGMGCETWAIGSARAEPTTELADRSPGNIQPFVAGQTVVAHNGTIANDRELVRKYGLTPSTDIDSGVIAPLIEKVGIDIALAALEGSYALAIRTNGLIYLVCNYKPIYILETPIAVYWASEPEMIPKYGMHFHPRKLPAYSITTISDGLILAEGETLLPQSYNRALVVCSGGLDSTTVLGLYHAAGIPADLLFFRYGCVAEERELEAIKAIAAHYGCGYHVLDMAGLYNSIGGSTLFTGEISKKRGGVSGAELALEWVPARNLVFLSAATAFAEAHGYTVIALGNNLEEAGAYPDNEPEFIRMLNEVMPYAVAANKRVTITQPVGHMMKREIVSAGLSAGVPYELTWSCYESGDRHCGECGPCFMRKTAFALNGVNDPAMTKP